MSEKNQNFYLGPRYYEEAYGEEGSPAHDDYARAFATFISMDSVTRFRDDAEAESAQAELLRRLAEFRAMYTTDSPWDKISREDVDKLLNYNAWVVARRWKFGEWKKSQPAALNVEQKKPAQTVLVAPIHNPGDNQSAPVNQQPLPNAHPELPAIHVLRRDNKARNAAILVGIGLAMYMKGKL